METVNTTKRSDLMKVDPRNIIVKEGFNARFDYGDIDQLKESIVENGLKVPLRGYMDPSDKEKFILTDGHRRMKAINKAIEEGNDIARVSLVKEEKGYNDEQRTFDLIICNDGKKLDSLEEAEVVARLLKFGYEAKEISEKTGRSLPHIYNMIRLSKVDKRIKNLIIEGKVSSGAVIQLINSNKDTDKHYDMLVEAIHSATEKVKDKVVKTKSKKKPSFSDSEKEASEKGFGNKEEVEVKQQVKATAKDIKQIITKNHLQILEESISLAKEKGYKNYNFQVVKTLVDKLKSKSTPEEISEMFK